MKTIIKPTKSTAGGKTGVSACPSLDETLTLSTTAEQQAPTQNGHRTPSFLHVHKVSAFMGKIHQVPFGFDSTGTKEKKRAKS